MTHWWYSLLLEKQIFYGIGSIALGVLVIQLLLTILGLGGDHDVDLSGHGDHDSGLGLLTIRTITAFFVGFGWGGIILLNNGYALVIAILGGTAAGTVFLFATWFLIHNLLRLQSSGNLVYANAIGSVGSVYSTIPAAEAGGGQLELVLQGRLMMAEAYTKFSRDLKPGSKARVVALIGQSTLVVEPLASDQPLS
ncbi:MAG TPA: hypothetical protein VK474_10800 [Chthoniobacterales bacterium]|nr:hypothetical protein [Chthoniobacterales bacterium]